MASSCPSRRRKSILRGLEESFRNTLLERLGTSFSEAVLARIHELAGITTIPRTGAKKQSGKSRPNSPNVSTGQQIIKAPTSCATWMVQAGTDPKSVQGQMRHSRISTTVDIYAQFVPEGQKRAAAKLTEHVAEQVENSDLMLVRYWSNKVAISERKPMSETREGC